ncbi:MAG: T9SS type A sorting domain-containing protein [Bacteroidales bacterium]|nr:T9SS type A sorting domain-containing protein [Bacteroidales bacterium]
MIYRILLFPCLLAFKLSYAQIPYNNRYFEKVFDEITIESDVVYGTAPALNFPYLDESNTSPQDLLMDIYQPVGDTLERRPALVCAHSGAFVSGSKVNEDMVAFCDSMARRGYLTASIDYRMGMNALSAASSTRAVYRGIQDGRTAIRFLKENAETYGIDTSNIYLLGSSAGGYIAQHNYFMDTEDERPPETFDSPDLGCLDCSGNDFPHYGKANGMMALWGALMDTNLIVPTDTLPVFLAHGTADETVPFIYGSAFGFELFPPTYGSGPVAEQLEYFGNNAETYFVLGAGHEFYGTDNGNWDGDPNPYWDSVFNEVETFALNIHKPEAGFVITQFENVAMFEDSSKNASSWYWDFGDGYFSTEQNPTHEFGQPGVFTVVQFVSSDLNSWDTASAFAYSWVGLEELEEPALIIYPNPAGDFVNIQNTADTDLKIQLTDISGKVLLDFLLEKQELKKLSLAGFEKGMYFILFRSGRVTVSRKVIKI